VDHEDCGAIVNEELTVGYHQQDTNYYCGAACAQMVLHSVGQTLISQDQLYNDNHNHSVEPGSWSTPPDGLQWTLNNLQSGKYFALDSLDSEDAISRMLCWTIHFWKVAPVALVEGGNHWVVVHGYTASAAPTFGADPSYTISSFDINNPWPPTPTPPPPPPHTDGDTCGSGGARGVSNVNVSYTSWQTDYMTANVFGTQWLGKFVAVCDPDPPLLAGDRAVPERGRLFDGDRLLVASEAGEVALVGIRQTGLSERERWRPVLHDVRSGDPILVQRLDRLDSYYWIVPLRDQENGLQAAVSIDARYGDYQSAMALREQDSVLFGFREFDETLDHVARQRIELPDDLGRLVIRPEGTCVHPVYVWKPCRESLSPFYPFRMVTVGPFQIYVRVFDGAIFNSLTNDKGGI
jgi:hypothetical protein